MVGWNIENETGPPWRNLEGEKLERAKEEYSIKLAGRKDSGEQQQHGTFECFLCAGTVLHTLHVLTCLIVRHLMKELHFTHAEPKAQRGKVAFTGPQSQWIAFGGSIIKLMSLSKDSFCHNSFIGKYRLVSFADNSTYFPLLYQAYKVWSSEFMKKVLSETSTNFQIPWLSLTWIFCPDACIS